MFIINSSGGRVDYTIYEQTLPSLTFVVSGVLENQEQTEIPPEIYSDYTQVHAVVATSGGTETRILSGISPLDGAQVHPTDMVAVDLSKSPNHPRNHCLFIRTSGSWVEQPDKCNCSPSYAPPSDMDTTHPNGIEGQGLWVECIPDRK